MRWYHRVGQPLVTRDSGRCNLKDADLAIGAGDPVSAALELDVNFASLERGDRS